MASTIQYTNCPFCDSTNFHSFDKVQDYTVSNELFEIMHCNSCENRFTQHIPVQNEIGKYYQSENYISHSDTQKDFISKIYHTVRNITLKKKKKLIINVTKKQKGNLLDIGAGTGSFINEMSLAGWQFTALEPDETAKAVAKSKYGLQLEDTDKLFSLTNETFDAITLWHVLEHIHTLKEYLKKFHQILKADGKLVIAVPNYTSFDASYYQQYWAGYDVPRHLYHFSPAGMQQLANQLGFTIVSTKAMWFDSVYVSLLSEKYKTGKSSFIKALFIGAISNIGAFFNSKKCSSVIYILQKK